jgi:hypothetical protein
LNTTGVDFAESNRLLLKFQPIFEQFTVDESSVRVVTPLLPAILAVTLLSMSCHCRRCHPHRSWCRSSRCKSQSGRFMGLVGVDLLDGEDVPIVRIHVVSEHSSQTCVHQRGNETRSDVIENFLDMPFLRCELS